MSIRYLPNTTDWLGRFRIEENPRNDHLISREVQQSRSYTGIEGIPVQDQAITESMGPIVDRTKEHLGTSDRMIMLTRRKLMRAAIALRDQGTVPAEVRGRRSAFTMCAPASLSCRKERDWLEYYNERRAAWSGGTAAPIERMRKAAAQAPEKAA